MHELTEIREKLIKTAQLLVTVWIKSKYLNLYYPGITCNYCAFLAHVPINVVLPGFKPVTG